MGLAAAPERYETAVKKMFPQGQWWDAQLADPESDASLFARAKSEGIARFRGRMDDLLAEGKPELTEELVADWERVLLGEEFPGDDIDERRLRLRSKKDGSPNRRELEKIAEQHGLVLREAAHPYRPRFFGFARFAVERVPSFAAFSVVRFSCVDPNYGRYGEAIRAEIEQGRFATVRFGTRRLAFVPAMQLRKTVYATLRRGCFGHGRPAQNRIANFPAEEARKHAAEKLAAFRFAAVRFGRSRLAFFAGRFDPALVADRDYFGGQVDGIVAKSDFYRRYAKALIDWHIAKTRPYLEFEAAASSRLLANHIPIFEYEGE